MPAYRRIGTIWFFCAYVSDLPPVEEKPSRWPRLMSSGIFVRSETRQGSWGVPGSTVIYWTNGSSVEASSEVPHQMVVGKRYQILDHGFGRWTIEEVVDGRESSPKSD